MEAASNGNGGETISHSLQHIIIFCEKNAKALLLVEGLGVGGGGGHVGIAGGLVGSGGQLELVGGLQVSIAGLAVGAGVVLKVEKLGKHTTEEREKKR